MRLAHGSPWQVEGHGEFLPVLKTLEKCSLKQRLLWDISTKKNRFQYSEQEKTAGFESLKSTSLSVAN